MRKQVEINDVFKTIGQPIITYVERDNGKYENELKSSIEQKGTLSLLTGPSKTGKTSLFKNVITDLNKEALIVRCDNQLTPDEFWRKALERINFERIAQKTHANEVEASGNVKGGVKFGWSWLAEVLGEVSLGLRGKSSDSEIRENILSKPSPDHLIPVLQELPYILVVEDFHYLNDDVKINIFQQWKTFVDNEVSVIVIGTTHHAVDIAFSNKDLVGRIAHIELNVWKTNDLKKIVKQGFDYLNIEIKPHLIKILAEESVGLPIVTQNTCLQLFNKKKISSLNISKKNEIEFVKTDLFEALNKVAITSYSSFKTIYEILITGLRKQRKYNTYELLLLLFQKDPITFKLKRSEIDERLETLEVTVPKPPSASINSTLSSLNKLQLNKNIKLLEWSKTDQTLYILEPSFLFYLRWKEQRDSQISFSEIIDYFNKTFLNINLNFKRTFINFKFPEDLENDNNAS